MDGFSNTPQYYIIQNGTIIQQGTWNTNFPLPYSLDNLAPGVYNFTLIAVEAGGAYAQFSTLVTVLNNSTTTFFFHIHVISFKFGQLPSTLLQQ